MTHYLIREMIPEERPRERLLSRGPAALSITELLAILTVVVLHRWKGNVLLSIAGGTALYMLLVQVVFA